MGNNINRFIRKTITNKIHIYDLRKISNTEINITIDMKELENIKKIKGLYKIKIIKYIGIENYKRILKTNSIIIISMIISLVLILFLSNFTFYVKIYHTNIKLKQTLTEELRNHGIKLFGYKKSYNEIENIKKQILEKYKNSIEWLEITRIGTMYKVRVEERIIYDNKEENKIQNIIANKKGIIKKIYASSGVITKLENEYVQKGDIIISGEIYLNENLKDLKQAKGIVYAETWYTVKIDFPLYYKESNQTSNKKSVLNLSFLNKDYNFFNIKKYKNYQVKNNILYENKLIPLKLMIQNQKELNIIEKIYTKEEAINKGIEYATKKIEGTLSKDEYIISKKVLKNIDEYSTIYMEIFFKVYENITAVENITPLEE